MSVGASVTLGAKASARQSIDVKTEIGLVAEASLTCLTALRERLLASQDIVLEDDPMLEDADDSDDADDCEFDLGDEDVPEEDDEVVGVSDQEIGPGWMRDEGFVLRVTPDPDAKGQWLVDVPQCGWEGLVGQTRRGKACVDAVSTRQHVYLRLAAWLEECHQDLLENGPYGPIKSLGKQKDLLAEELDGHALFWGIKTISGRETSTAAVNLSRYLKNVDLSWPQGSIPLRKLFAD